MPNTRDISGIVEAVLTCNDGTRSEEQEKIQLFDDGVKGDRHAGHHRLIDVRDKALTGHGIPKGMVCAPTRQVSVVSREELDEIGRLLNLTESIPPGIIGENLVVSGIPQFTQLPPGTYLCFKAPNGTIRTAVIAIWAENMPCSIAGDSLGEYFLSQPDARKNFSHAAIGKRGIVGFIMCSGVIKKGDTITAHIPKQRPCEI